MMAVWAQIFFSLVPLALLANGAPGKLCWMGQEPDPESHDRYRWVIPVPNPCMCTEIRIGSLNTQTPRRPFKVTYHDTFVYTDDRDEIRRRLNCSASTVALNVESLNLTLPDNAVLSDGINQTLTFDLNVRPSPGAAEPINIVKLDRYEVTAYLSQDKSGSSKVAAQVVSLTPAQDSAVVADGEVTTFSDLDVTLDLTRVNCSELMTVAGAYMYMYVCAELSPSATAAKEWKQSDDATTIACFPVCCAKSVDFKPEAMHVIYPSNLAIQDGRLTSMQLSFHLSSMVMSTIREQYITPGVESVAGDITTWLEIPNLEQANMSYIFGQWNRMNWNFPLLQYWAYDYNPLTYMYNNDYMYDWDYVYLNVYDEHFNNGSVTIQTLFNLSDVECKDTLIWDVCIDFQPSDSWKCYWNHLPTATHQLCTPVYCVPDIQLNVDELTVVQPDYIADRTVNNVTFDLKFTPATGSSGYINYAGDERYRVLVYLTNTLQGYPGMVKKDAVLTLDHQQLNITDNVQAVFQNLTVELELLDHWCFYSQFICAKLLPAEAGNKKWIQSRNANTTACASLPCISYVKLDVMSLVVPEHQSYILSDGVRQDLSFDLTFKPEYRAQIAINSITHDRYEVKAYLSEDMSGSIKVATQVVTLTSTQDSMDVYLYRESTFADLAVTLNLTGVTCTRNVPTYFCVELGPSMSAAVVWQQHEEANASLCLPVYCPADVQLNVDELTVIQPDYIADRTVNNVTFDLKFTPATGSSGYINYAGDERYRVEVFLACTLQGDSAMATKDAVLTLDHQQLYISDNVQAVFNELTVELDLLTACFTQGNGPIQFLCAKLLPAEAANKKWIQSGNADTTACASLPCISNLKLRVVALVVPEHQSYVLSDNVRHDVTFNLTFKPDDYYSNALRALKSIAYDRYEVKAYLSEDMSGSIKVATQVVTLTSTQDSMQVLIRHNSTFENLAVTLNLTGVTCTWNSPTYFCVELGPSMSAAMVWQQHEEAIASLCLPVYCPANVELNVESLSMMEPTDGVLLDGTMQRLTFELGVFASSGSSLPINSVTGQRYNVTAYLSETEPPSSAKVAFAVATLASMTVVEEGISVFQNVRVTLNLTGLSCAGSVYTRFCVELQPSVEAAKVWRQSENARTVHCAPIHCAANVELNVVYVSGTLSADGNIPMNVTLMARPSIGSAAAINTVEVDRYQIQCYLKGMNGNIKGDREVVGLSPEQKLKTVTDEKYVAFTDLYISRSTTEINCTGTSYTYLCADIAPSPEAASAWRQSSYAVTTGCFPVCCEETVEISLDPHAVQWPSDIIFDDGDMNAIGLSITLSITDRAADLIQAIPASLERHQVTAWLTGNAPENDFESLTISSLTEFVLGEMGNEKKMLSKSINVEFDLRNVDCYATPIHYICVSILPPQTPQCYWDYLPSVINSTCTPITCIPNVELNVDTFSVTTPQYITDNVVTSVTFDLLFTPTSGSSAAVTAAGTAAGTARYLVQVCLAKNLHGHDPIATTDAVLTPAQSELTLADDVQTVISAVTVELDLITAVDCSTSLYKYICVSLLPSQAAARTWKQSPLAQSTACASMPCVACQNHIQLFTSSDMPDKLGPLHTNYITFSVQTSQGAVVTLYDASNTLHYCEFTVYNTQQRLVLFPQNSQETTTIPMSEFDMFWIWWDTSTILFGTDISHQPILSVELNLLATTVKFSSLYDESNWHLCNIVHGGIPPHFDYPPLSNCDTYTAEATYGSIDCTYSWEVCQLQGGEVHFQVYASDSVQIALSVENFTTGSTPMYEISIPSWSGSQVTIARCAGCEPVATAIHPWLVNFYDYTEFYVSITDTRVITIRNSTSIILEWRDPYPISVAYCGVCTKGDWNYGLWKFCG